MFLKLLGTVKKLLGVCADFALYMQNLRTSGTEDFNEEVARYSSTLLYAELPHFRH